MKHQYDCEGSRRSAALLSAMLLPLLVTVDLAAQEPGLDAGVPFAAFHNGVFPAVEPGTTLGGSWATQNALPNHDFVEPVRIVEHPRENKLLIVSKTGLFTMVNNDPSSTQATILLNLSSKTNYPQTGEGGATGFVFHPEFGDPQSPNRGYIYVSYRHAPGISGMVSSSETVGYNRISRFTVPDGASSATLSSELVLIDQYDRQHWHPGGSMFFGADGFLYIGLGDEGNLYSRSDSTQRLDGGLWSGILRIDVNNDPLKSSPISRQPLEASEINSAEDSSDATRPSNWPHSATRGYSIPFDNPFYDLDHNPNQGAPSPNLEEFYAIGFRNPWVISQDPVTKQIWYADVGEKTREEIGRVVKGGNYQWGYLEGRDFPGPISKPTTIIGSEQSPVLDYPRIVGKAVIGAGVYRGGRFPELYGKYLFSDFIDGRLWALDVNLQGPVAIQSTDPDNLPGGVEFLMNLPKGFGNGVDAYCLTRDGRILMAKSGGNSTGGGKVLELVRQGQPTPQPPTFLSQTGIFKSITNFKLIDAFIPYSLNEPFWSDGASKSRWVAIPNNGTHDTPAEQIQRKPDGDFVFPTGTLMVKHFELETDWRNPDIRKRLETRIGVQTQNGGWYGVTYRWNDAGTDAQLLFEGETASYQVTNLAGETFNQTWLYPSRLDCRTCHNSAADGSLGLSIHQLNRNQFYPLSQKTSNQLFTFNHLNLFANPLIDNEIPNMLKAAAIDDQTASVELRARSYLDSNCSYCHQPGGVLANFDARLSTALKDSGLLFGSLVESFGLGQEAVIVPGDLEHSVAYVRANSAGQSYSMPPIAKAIPDMVGMEVLRDWILKLAPRMGNQTNQGGAFIDVHGPSLYVNETDTYTNTTSEPQVMTVNEFRFFAERFGNPLTPFVVRVGGSNNFTVLAIGTTRASSEYKLGENILPFDKTSVVTIELQPGETIAPGFMDSFPDGSGWGAMTVIPAESNGGATQDELWALLPNPLVNAGSGYNPNVETARIVEGENPRLTNAGRALTEYTTIRRSYRFAIGLQQGDGFGPPGSGGSTEPFPDAVVLGNDSSQSASRLDNWASNLYVNKSDLITNNTGDPVEIQVDTFNFHAARLSGPVTPFIVRMQGGNNFTVLAVGTTRTKSAYVVGENKLSFDAGSAPRIILQPGETIGTGFLTAFANGSGAAAGPIPNQIGGDALWFSGGPAAGDSASVTVGSPITPGLQSSNLNRDYRYNIGISLYSSSGGGTDTDGDGVVDSSDAFPNDPSEWADNDGDGRGNNSDAFPNNPSEWADSDGDGRGNNSDAFPNNPLEWADSDEDGMGDNSDPYPNDPLNGQAPTAVVLGNDSSQTASRLDNWASNLYVNKSDVFTNNTASPVEIRMDTFNFHAARLSGPVTPFIVRMQGGNNFTVLAVGTTRTKSAYVVGENKLSFDAGNAPRIILQPGETIGTGFLTAFANGSGAGPGPIPNQIGGDALWFSGGPAAGDSASVTVGSPITPGLQSSNLNRDYRYNIGISLFPSSGGGTDTDGDGVADSSDAFPNDPSEWADSDGDGRGNNSDAFPNNPSEWADSDGDGMGDNSDPYPNDPLNGAGSGQLANASFEIDSPGIKSVLNSWTVTQGTVEVITAYKTEGSQALELNGNAPGGISQTVAGLDPGAVYALFIDWADHPNRSSVPILATADVYVDGVLIGTIRNRSKAPAFIDQNGFEFTAPSDGIVTVLIVSTTPGDKGLILDDLRMVKGGLPNPPEATMLQNGSFEAPIVGNPSSNPHVCGFDLPGWLVTRESVDLITIAEFGAADGDTIVDVGGHGPGGIAQTIIGLTPGGAYRLKFAYARHRGWPESPILTADVLINDAVVRSLSRDINKPQEVAPNFIYETIDVIAPANGKVTIEFRSTSLTVGGCINFDDVSFGPPPDPTAIILGNDSSQSASKLDSWASNLYVNKSDVFTNNTAGPVEIQVNTFNFHAARLSGPVTPFIVRMQGGNNFTVLAVGTTRTKSAYVVGENKFSFYAGNAPRIVLQPGQTIGTGFLNAFADGSGAVAGPIPNQSGGDSLWFSGGKAAGDSATVTVGSPIKPGLQSGDVNRDYRYNIGISLSSSP